MKSKKQLNFYSALETETHLTPRAAYTSLAIDAALLHFNEQLPELSDDENQRLLEAAHVAAESALILAHVPNDWLDLMVALNYNRQEKVRSEIWDAIFDLLPDDGKELGEQKTKAENKIMACARPGREEAMRRALNDLGDIYMGEVLQAIYAAFQLGYEIAHDPTRLLIEKARS